MEKKEKKNVFLNIITKGICTVIFLVVLFLGIEAKAVSGNVEINTTNFPDDNFRKYITEGFDKNTDGKLDQSELSDIREISCPFKEISSIKGISFFGELTTLNIAYNQITSLDVSQNTKLEKLYCESTNLTKINVSKNVNLKQLDISYTEISELNISNNTALEILWCNNSRLTTIDVRKNKNLIALDCSDNNINSLDVSQNAKLEELKCSSMGVSRLGNSAYMQVGPGLSELNVSSNKNLVYLSCNSNSLSKLDLSKNSKLKYLKCADNNLTSLNIKNNTQLKEIGCTANELTELDVSNNTLLTEIICNQNKLEKLDISNNKELIQLLCTSNKLKSLNVKNNDNLLYLECDDNNFNQLDFRGNAALNECVRKGNYYKSYLRDGVDSYVLGGTMSNYGRGCSAAYVQVDSTTRIVSEEVIELQEIKFDYAEITMNEGDTFTLNILYNPSNYNEYIQNRMWWTSNASIATVSEGVVTAIGEGRTWISTMVGEKQANCYVTVTKKDDSEEQVRNFVSRFYTIILQRSKINEDEINYYTSRLLSKELDGCSVAKGFVMSPEYTNKGDKNIEFVNKMYAAFFNRDADDAAYYVNLLESGQSREVVLAGFVNSPEFKNLCADYGINPGELVVEPQNNNQSNNQGNNGNNQGSGDITKLNLDSSNVNPDKLDAYVKGLYQQILGRGYDEGGLQYWKEQIMAGTTYDAATAARVGFFESEEYKNKNKNSEQFVTDCYHAFLGRDPEPDGLSYWMKKIDSGEYSKQKVIDLGFGHSEEFKNILRGCGFKIIE